MPDTKPEPEEEEPERPPARDYTVSFRVPPAVKKEADERAKSSNRTLSEILRTWLTMFSIGEAPIPPEPEPLETKRAAKRPRKTKPKPAPPPTPLPAPKPKKKASK